MTRAQVRDGIAQYFGGAVLDAADQVYRPTPLAAQGLAGVAPYFAESFRDEVMAIKGLGAGRGRGAIMCVHIAETTEVRHSIGGIFEVPYQIQLYLWHLSLIPSVQDAQADRDDLVEAVIARIHDDPTLGDVVVQAGEGQRGISVSTPPPVTEPSRYTRQDAVISFQAEVYPYQPNM
jgi:hypothetical protein